MRLAAGLPRAETKPCKSFLNFRTAHEQLPEEPRSVILYHNHLRALVDSQVPLRKPVILLAECIIEAELSEQPVSVIVVEISHCIKRLFRGIGY